ncbi:DUF4309 domain-containing protein [Halalkalibacter okhensis]|uniref:DUF4309 domain-containing protein n=1 Tax=Halalkalibacter okhensis TaxID=333138 RepID=A0A0B0ILG3_9BACI|nr:DUF4309 domain-containing protein [Halalkalibacter okhensis]KHF40864.1 hypothetical protein LQ50_07135 [Halalkalibacter okhensis]
MKNLLFIVLLLLLTGCGQVSGEEPIVEKQGQITKVDMSQTGSFLSFSWIEQGYTGIFTPVQAYIEQSIEEVRKQLGEPIAQGYYEGGVYLEYDQATYFFDPETNIGVAIAINIGDHQLTNEEMKRQLGTPDQSEINEMDGYWTFVYKLDNYELMFEAKTEESHLAYAWLKRASENDN